MKKINFILLLLLATIGSFAQAPKTLFTSNEITWFGLDFSKAKFMGSFAAYGDAGQKNGQQIRDQYFKGWNDLILKESEKYSFKDAYKKTSVPFDISIVTDRNAAVDPDAIFSEKSEDKNHLKKEDIASIVNKYKSNKKGLGLLYVVDTFDKLGTEATIWVTFFDIDSRNVLLTEKFTGTPKGFGIKNFWAGAVLDVIKQSGKSWKTWEKQAK